MAVIDSAAAATRTHRLARLAFWCVVVCAGLVPWLAPRPPLVDLPQHAAQATLCLDLIRHRSPWQALFVLDYVKPYLLAPALATALVTVVSGASAMKLLLTAACWAFVLVAVKLRKEFGGDERLDWFFLVGPLGYPWKWGFVPYLLAAPMGLWFLLVVRRYSDRLRTRTLADRPTAVLAGGVTVFLAGVALFFSHGLVFMCSCAIAALMLVVGERNRRRAAVSLLPIAALAAIACAYMLRSHAFEAAMYAAGDPIPTFEWELGPERLVTFFLYPWGTGRDWPFAPATAVIMVLPFVMGCRLQRDARALAPFALVVAMAAIIPNRFLNAATVYERLALFSMPFYALMFAAPGREASTDVATFPSSAGVRRISPAAATAHVVLALIPIVFLLSLGLEMRAFARESAGFETVLQAARPGRRALALVFDPASAAARNDRTYMHFASWYQADKGGLVDFNFGWLPPLIARYDLAHLPAVRPGFEWEPWRFDWQRTRGADYDYFFVRRASPLPAGFFDRRACDVTLVKSAGEWALYEKRGCQ